MEILKRLNDRIKGFASLANIGYNLFEVNLEGEVYKRSTSRKSMHYKAERVGNKWKLHKFDVSGNLIERVMRTDVLVGCAWYNIDENYGGIVSMPILSEDVKNSLVYPKGIYGKPTIKRVEAFTTMLLNMVKCGILRL